MPITINADSSNTKTIPTLLEDMGYSLPCNCHGRHHCPGKVYSFDCSFVPKEPVTISLPEKNRENLSGISLEDRIPTTGSGDTILIDLGTTTVAMALIDRTTAELRQTSVFANPQRKYGADVIARIQASIQGEREQLRITIQNAISRHASSLCQHNHQTLDEITHCFIAGNTTMIHLLMGYECTSLSASPFIPEKTPPVPFLYRGCRIQILPWFSAFVGGDIMAGMYACHMENYSPAKDSDTTLLIDLGTNGEMLLRHREQLYSTATAAGPAFEGNGLSCGCPGIPGAISSVRLLRLRPSLTTIDNKLPVGICGSGAISLCAELLRHGYITSEGILTPGFADEGIFLGHSPSHTALYFTAEDLRHVQLSIAAIAAGIDTLIHEAGIGPTDISHVYLGGGFGFYLDLEACRTLKLFSSLPISLIQPMGNTCLQGLFRLACDACIPPVLTPPVTDTINLADHPCFQKQFISHMTYSG